MTADKRPEYYNVARLAKRASLITTGLTALVFLPLLFLSYFVIGASGFGRAPFFIMTVTALIGSVIIGLFAFQAAKKLLQPFEPLTVELRKAAKGDLTADFSTSMKGRLGFLAYDMQEMMHAFKAIVERIIVTTIGNVLSFGEEFKKLVARAADSSIAQSNQVKNIAAAAGQMSTAAETVKKNTETARIATELAMKTAEEGAVIASDTVEVFNIVGASTATLSEHVEELYDSAHEIDQSRPRGPAFMEEDLQWSPARSGISLKRHGMRQRRFHGT